MTDDQVLSQFTVRLPEVPSPYRWLDFGGAVGFVLSGHTLAAAPTYKRYRVHIGIGTSRQDRRRQFVALATYGSADGDRSAVLKWSDSLDEVIAAANKQVTAKMKPSKGYEPFGPQGPIEFTRGMVVAAAEQIVASFDDAPSDVTCAEVVYDEQLLLD